MELYPHKETQGMCKKIIHTGYILCFSLQSLCSLHGSLYGSSQLSCTYIPCMSSIPAIPYTKRTVPTTMYLHSLHFPLLLVPCVDSHYSHVSTFHAFSCMGFNSLRGSLRGYLGGSVHGFLRSLYDPRLTSPRFLHKLTFFNRATCFGTSTQKMLLIGSTFLVLCNCSRSSS